MVFIGWVSAIAIGRLSQMLAAGAFLTEYDPDFFAGVPWIPFVEQRLFGKGKGKQAEIQYSCGFAAGWLPKS